MDAATGNSTYKNLEQVLEEEIKIYRGLLDVVRKEKEALIAAQIPPLEEINRAKENLILKIKTLDRQREKYATELARQVGVNFESPRLLEIAGQMPDVESEKLRSIHNTLDLLIKRIRELNKYNEELVAASLKTVTGALGAIRNSIAPKPTYKPSGSVASAEVAGHFVHREV